MKSKMKSKRKKPEKGQYGYVNYTKKKRLICTILSFIAVLIIFFTGVIIYHTNKSIYTVLAAVSSLPAAKLLITYIVIAPYHTGSKTLYDRLSALQRENTGYQAILAGDMVITSTQKAMYIQFAYIINGHLIMYTDDKKTDIKKTEDYIKDILKENCSYSMIKLYKSEEDFIKQVSSHNMETGKELADKRLYDRLCTYCA